MEINNPLTRNPPETRVKGKTISEGKCPVIRLTYWCVFNATAPRFNFEANPFNKNKYTYM